MRAYRYLSAIPDSVKPVNYWYFNISNLAYILILFLHLSWIIVFHAMGQQIMVNAQFVSIACYVCAIMLNRHGLHVWGTVVCLLEVNLHQILATATFGWATGFQNFIPLVAILPYLKYNESWIYKFGMGIGCLLGYLYIDFFVKNTPPLSELSSERLNFLNFSNVVLCFILVTLWGIVLAISYQRTVDALLKKEQELFASEKAREQAHIIKQLELKERDNEIFLLRTVTLKKSNDEILAQKAVIEALVSEQEIIISQRTHELEEANSQLIVSNNKLIELIQYNAHNLREPLTRVMGAMMVVDYVSPEEFKEEIWPQMEKAVNDLDVSIREVVHVASNTLKAFQ